MADKIIIGSLTAPLYEFESGDIDHEKKPLQLVLSHALSGDELAIDQLLPRVFSDAYIRVGFVPSGSSALVTSDGKRFVVMTGPSFLDKLPYATPIWYYTDGVLMGKFYSKQVVRTGQTAFDLLAMSPIGVLEGQNHVGNVYTGQTWAAVAADVIGGAVPFTVASDVASIPVFGWLPYATRRDNLHELLFAFGVMAEKDSAGDLVFRFPDTTTVKAVPDGRIFFGGSVNYETPATRAEITEHAFLKLPSDELVTLFDNTDGSGVADYTPITFQNAPIHDLEVSGNLIVHESSVNHAVLSGTGILTGRRYTHTTKIIVQDSGVVGENKTVSVTGRTLVNVANSQNVARRVLSFYSASRTISADLIVEGEKPGDLLSFNDPFGDPATAFLASLDGASSSFLRAACQLITNYTPAWGGNNYSRAIVLTGTGSWTVPAERFRAILIGAGSGGDSGGKGEDGEDSHLNKGSAGAGGSPGAPGAGGKILSVELTKKVGTVISYSCGVGGAGGVCTGLEPTPGMEGGTTTFGNYSSASGLESSVGAVDLFTGEVYALPGLADGLAGANGADTNNPEAGSVVYDGVTYTGGKNGEGVEGWASGYAYGGFGGGAAAGANGKDGEDGSTTVNNGYGFNNGGNAGAGGNAIDRADASQYGCGGDGGHGGGGGGAGGPATGNPDTCWGGAGGVGGLGGKGGNGADGCIIVYY